MTIYQIIGFVLLSPILIASSLVFLALEIIMLPILIPYSMACGDSIYFFMYMYINIPFAFWPGIELKEDWLMK